MFYNSTEPNGTAIAKYRWNFGDPHSIDDASSLNHPSYTYLSGGAYDARLVATNTLGCSDTVTHVISMYGSPGADFKSSVACQGQPTHFADESDPALAPIIHSRWIISDGVNQIGYKSGENADFTFDSPQMYTILHTVTDSNNCSDSISYNIDVVPSPVSVFNVNKNFENIQGKVQFENGSIGADEYLWDFGNGETSAATSPVLTYNEDGNYFIQLYTRNEYGCVDSTGVMLDMMFKGLYVPNALILGPVSSTNLWKPVGVNLEQYRADVYDRWGVLLWHSDQLTDKGTPAEGWDGTYKGETCKEGVYVWTITAIYRDGSIWRNEDAGNHDGLSEGTSGTITLIR
jgi:PKD repeat protein